MNTRRVRIMTMTAFSRRSRTRRAVLAAAAGAVLAMPAACELTDAQAPEDGGAAAARPPDGNGAAGGGAGAEHGAGARGRPGVPMLTVAATGDFLLHDVLVQQAAEDRRSQGRSGYDLMPMLAGIKPVIGAADLGICHVETPLGRRAGPFSGYPAFNSPPQIVDAVAGLGYDTCSTASNHTVDQGEPGVRRTLAALDAAGVRHAGSARTAEEARRINLLDVKGVKVAHLSYTQDTNGIPPPAPWSVNAGLSAPRILADAARAKAAGARLVVLSLHWGEEYRHEPTAAQRALARTLLASKDVDLIVGCHVHVVQPFERINGKWVAYGMGNQVANPNANDAATHEGVIARFTFTRGPSGWTATPAFTPTVVVPGPPIRLHALGPGSDHQAAIARTSGYVRSLGANVPLAPDANPSTVR